MSSASKSMSKDKKTGREPVKASLKPSGMASLGNGIPTSAYNPILGTFHTLETVTSSPNNNGRFRNIDESDDHSGGECDAISNNGSWSGESEEHKDKLPNHPIQQEAIPGADLDKREKARQKNERKHQRQKEKRAQELHEKCCGFLMSRKLETLTKKLVVMGFTSERATMALILNDGRVEESVAWLLERGEDPDKPIDESQSAGSKLKIDVSEELAQIADMTVRFNCSKQEVERAIVTCEGDLDMAVETLKLQKQELPVALFKSEEARNLQLNCNGKHSSSCSQNLPSLQPKPNSPNPGIQRRDEKDSNYTKTPVHLGVSPDSRTRIVQPLRRPPPNYPEIAVPSERRMLNVGSNNPVSYSSSSPLQITNPPTKTEARYVAAGTELKNPQKPGSLKEPVIVMRRHQTINGSQVPVASIASSLPSTTSGWNHNTVDIRNNGLVQISSSRSSTSDQVNLGQLYLQQLQYEQCRQSVPGNGLPDSQVINGGSSLSNRMPTSPSIAAASSLGLFSGTGLSNGSSGSDYLVDWKTGFMMPLDYNRIDWSLDRPASSPLSPEGALWSRISSLGKNSAPVYDCNGSRMGSTPTMRALSSSRSGIPFAGLQNGGMSAQAAPAAGSREWSSPFEAKDLFSLPRQFVHSPSL